jgi:flagellar FliL protein
MATQPEPAAAAPSEAPAPKKPGAASALMPALLAIIGAPALTWAVCQFVLIPALKKELAGPVDPAAAHAAEAAPSGHGKSAASEKPTNNAYKFENIVVNLAGTMGTRYLKTTFLVTGADAALVSTFESNQPALLDVTINVLSSLSLTDLEEAGSKNLIREKLVQSYNQSLGRKVAEQIFFSDFVVQ